MAAVTPSSRRQIPPQRPQQASPLPTGVTVTSVLRSDSGSTSSKRREKFQDNDGSCRMERDSVHKDDEEGSSELGSAVEAASDVRVRTRTAVTNVTVGDANALECGVCFLPLRPPIFQCEVGHMVCYGCVHKLITSGNTKCHDCGVATYGYRMCYAMDNLVDCIRVPCPYQARGCDKMPPYHSLESHCQVCPHGPYHCPGESCGVIGSRAALLDHFAGVHNWQCTTMVRVWETFSISVRVGFYFFLLKDHNRSDGDKALPALSRFVVNVTQERLGRAISVLCIHPHASATAKGAQQLPLMQCELVFARDGDKRLCHTHYQSSVFKVVFTDLSNGLPNPEDCFQFLVPYTVLEVGDDKNSIEVKVRITI